MQASNDQHAASFRWLPLLAAPLIAAIGLLWLDTTDVDRVVETWFFDRAANGFPLRYDRFFEVVLHQWAKHLVVLIGCLAWAGFFLSFVLEQFKPQRRLLLFVALALALAPAAVGALKSVSSKHCPWYLEEYGGLIPYTRLFEPTPPGLAPGKCFPAGHASAGFALMAFYFVGRVRGRSRAAWAGLATGLGAGLALGFARMMQGAHFLSHTLWSALICWLVIVAVYAAILHDSAHC